MVLQFDGRLSTGQEALDGDLRSLHLVTGPDGNVLYAGTGRHGGLSTYALTPDAAAQVVDTVDFRTLPGGVADTRLDMLKMQVSARRARLRSRSRGSTAGMRAVPCRIFLRLIAMPGF